MPESWWSGAKVNHNILTTVGLKCFGDFKTSGRSHTFSFNRSLCYRHRGDISLRRGRKIYWFGTSIISNDAVLLMELMGDQGMGLHQR